MQPDERIPPGNWPDDYAPSPMRERWEAQRDRDDAIAQGLALLLIVVIVLTLIALDALGWVRISA